MKQQQQSAAPANSRFLRLVLDYVANYAMAQ